eukprot:7182390-Heterocapsa_arctica.AAC.1
MSRGRLDAVVDQCANDNDKWALQARRHEATTIITSTIQPAEAACIKPTTGDMQGDCAAAQKFALAYDPCTEDIRTTTRTLLDEERLDYIEPITGKHIMVDHA